MCYMNMKSLLENILTSGHELLIKQAGYVRESLV